MKIAIIGAGWLGCHLALQLKNRNLNPFIFETQNEIFCGASGFNQCRLHLGFHYPRAEVTRSETQRCFIPFSEQYKEFIVNIPDNLYGIAKNNSLVDYENYCKIFQRENVFFQKLDSRDFFLSNLQGLLRTEEKALDLQLVKKHFTHQLEDSLILNTSVVQIDSFKDHVLVNGEKFDCCINCTYQQFHRSHSYSCFYEPCIMLVYEKQSTQMLALTVVDGPFGSFYPCPETGNYNNYYLSTVPDTPLARFYEKEQAVQHLKNLNSKQILKIKSNMENLISEYYPNFREEFKYLRHVTSIKTKFFSENDERNSFFEEDDRYLHAFIGKLSQVCLIEDKVLATIDKHLRTS